MKNINKKAIIITISAILALLAVLAVLEKTRVTNFIRFSSGPAETKISPADQKKLDQASQQTKKDFIEQTPPANSPAPTKPQPSASLTAEKSSDGKSVTILTKLTGFAGGNCDLTIANGSKTYTSSAAIIYQPDFSSCAGFSVPIEKLGNGQWQITLNAAYNDQTASGTATIGV